MDLRVNDCFPTKSMRAISSQTVATANRFKYAIWVIEMQVLVQWTAIVVWSREVWMVLFPYCICKGKTAAWLLGQLTGSISWMEIQLRQEGLNQHYHSWNNKVLNFTNLGWCKVTTEQINRMKSISTNGNNFESSSLLALLPLIGSSLKPLLIISILCCSSPNPTYQLPGILIHSMDPS